MKKLLLTLFAAAAVFVACDKDNDQLDTMVIEPAVSDFDSNAMLDNIVSRLSGGDFTLPASDKGSASSARTGSCVDARTAGDRFGNRLDGEVIANASGEFFLLIRDEAEVGVGAFTPVLKISFVKSADGSTFQVYSNGVAVGSSKPLSTGFSALFEAPFTGFTFVESINMYGDYLADSSLAAAGISCSTAPPVGWTSSTSSDVTTFTHPTFGSYTVQGAPFPLSGYLATVVTQGTNPGTANYAGTTMGSVTSTIQNDFEN